MTEQRGPATMKGGGDERPKKIPTIVYRRDCSNACCYTAKCYLVLGYFTKGCYGIALTRFDDVHTVRQGA